MTINAKKFITLGNKFKNVQLVNLSEGEEKVPVFAIIYQKNGLPGKPSISLMEANRIWDLEDSRPNGYMIAASFELKNGNAATVLVHESWLGENKLKNHESDWEKKLLA